MKDTITLIGVVAAAIVGIGGITATLWIYSRVKALEMTVHVLTTGNEGLRAEIEDKDRQHASELERITADHRAAMSAAGDRISRLEGHNAALVDGVADRIANAIGERLQQSIEGAFERLFTEARKGTTR